MSKTAITAAPIMPVLAERWSPRSYDSSYVISQHEMLAILEAARWAPSANNAQPWRFSVATHGTPFFDKVVEGLSGFNAAWAPKASAILVVSVVATNADGSDNKSAPLDAGITIGHLITQVHELGLHAHVIGGVLHDVMHKNLELADNLQVMVALTIGKLAPATDLEGPAYEREIAVRTRLELDEIVLHGKP